MNWEWPGVQGRLQRGRGNRSNCQNWLDHGESMGFQKNCCFCFIGYTKVFDCVDHKKQWKILKEMGMSDYLICFLSNLNAHQEATVGTGHGTMDWFQIGKGVHQGCILSSCLFNLYAEYIMWNARLDESQTAIKIAMRNINNLRHADDTILMAESEEELKSLWWEWKRRGKSSTVKKLRSWHLVPTLHGKQKGGKWKQWQILFSWAPKSLQMVTEAMILRCLLLGRKAMAKLDSVLKSRDIMVFTKAHIVKAMVYPVVTYGYEKWSIKRLSMEELMLSNCGAREHFWVFWTARRSNQSILKEINFEYSLEWLLLKLKLEYFDKLIKKANSLEKTMVLGKIGGKRRADGKDENLDSIVDSMHMN